MKKILLVATASILMLSCNDNSVDETSVVDSTVSTQDTINANSSIDSSVSGNMSGSSRTAIDSTGVTTGSPTDTMNINLQQRRKGTDTTRN